MIKPFLTYQQQIDKLVLEKHLIVDDRTFAEDKLKEIGYFTLIGGYKVPFRNVMTRVYVNNTTFEDIYALYCFDSQLRELVFQYLCQIEKKISTSIAYAFCERYGESQTAYLDVRNYNYTSANQSGIDKLIRMLGKLADDNTDYEYIIHQRKAYHNVPLWVLINALTFGQVSKMYSFLLPAEKSRVSRNFEFVNEKELEQYLKVLVLYRNVCAHNERLFSHKVYSEIPDTILHEKLNISKTGNQYTFGKRDLFAVVIAFRYLLPNESFRVFKTMLKRTIQKYLKKSNRIIEEQLLAMMGFPVGWEKVGRYKIR